MKKSALFIFMTIAITLFYYDAFAQTGSFVYTIAGNGTVGYSGDGGPATAAAVNQAKGVCQDAADNIYISDIGSHTIRKINAVTGVINTIAGNGSSGYSGDGGPAISATLNQPQGIACDAAGNVYVADQSNRRVRRIDAATGIIITVAGNGTIGFTGDGGQATAALIEPPINVYVDASNNLYILPWTGINSTIRKVDAATGIITTIAGIAGPVGFSGDGGPATNAQINSPYQMVIDNTGNLFFTDNGSFHIRKIDASGIITTIAGDGTSSFTDGVPATASGFGNPRGLAIDCNGNILVGDHGHQRIRKIDASTGIITTIAGGGVSTAEGSPALTAMLAGDYLLIDLLGNIIFADGSDYIKKITNYFPGMISSLSDSFSVHLDVLCSGPRFYLQTLHYRSGLSITSFYGDGNSDSTPVLNGFGGGYALVTHNYSLPGTYSIKHILYDGVIAVDSFMTPYEYKFCKTLTSQFYYDVNGDCSKESNEPFILNPVLTEIDSNGMVVDTVSATSGFYYSAFGVPGDVYTMKIISTAPGLITSCPSTGILTDTLQASLYGQKSSTFAFNCSTLPGFDLSINATFRAAPIAAKGDIIVTNSYCTPEAGMITLNMSPKYVFSSASIPPSTITGSAISWNFTSLSSVTANPLHIHYTLSKPTSSSPYLPGDTVNSVNSVSPVSSDLNPANNVVTRQDTIKSSLDPNYVEVVPEGCISAGIELTYTIGFENTGNDTAHNIYVLDSLSNDLDPATFEVITASSNMNTAILKSGTFNIAKFDFPDIMLPDSSHHDQCYGMVMFKIKTRNGLPDGTTISNRAGIFFDINPVVLTNTVENIIGCVTSTLSKPATSGLQLFPNPTTDELTIKTTQNAFTNFTITNSIGQQMLQQPLPGAQTKVNVSKLAAGLYYITFRGENGTEVRKFVKS